MGISNRFSSDSRGSASLIRHGRREGLFIDADLVARGAPAFEVLLRYLAEVDDVTRDEFEHLRRVFEAGWQKWASSSTSTPPVPHPDHRNHDRIGTTEAGRRLHITARAVRKMCERGQLLSARPNGRGWWSIDAAEVDGLAAGSDGEGMCPSDPASGSGHR